MKTFKYSLLAAALACGLANAQTAYTTPVGYTTETVKGSTFNLLGLTLQQSTVSVGSLSAVSPSSVEDTSAQFDTTLTAGSTYVLQITSGAGLGTIQEITSWTNTTLNTVVDLSTVNVAIGDQYSIRKAATISDIFGPANEAGLLEGNASTADIIWVPTGGGNFAKYFYSPAVTFPVPAPAGWKSTGGADAADEPIVYLDSIYIQRRGIDDISLVVSGEVQTNPVLLALEGGQFNYIGGVYPAGSTLGNTGLENSVLSGTATTADIVWLPDGLGDYNKYFYSPAVTFPVPAPAGWKSTGGSDATNVPMTSGAIIQRRGGSVNALISPPSSYQDL